MKMLNNLQLHLPLLLGSGLIAYFLAEGDLLVGITSFLICSAILEGSLMLVMRLRLAKIQQEGEQFHQSVGSLGLIDARSRAIEILYAAKDCVTNAQTTSIDLTTQDLPADVKTVFSQYKRIRFNSGDVLELRETEGPFVQAGQTFDGAKLLIRRQDGALLEWEGDQPPKSQQQADYPSLWHWILNAAGSKSDSKAGP